MTTHTYQLLVLGLTLSLLGAPTLLILAEFLDWNSLGLPVRLALWTLAGIVCGITALAHEPWSYLLGPRGLSWRTVIAAVAATFTMLAVWPLLQYIQRKLGGISVEQNTVFQTIVALPLAYRLFLIVTAALTEEILYRGFAIGIGKTILSGTLAASTVSVVIFTVSHFRWGLSHMLSVLWAAVVFTILFVVTGDLLACIVAHASIDAVGLVIAPAVMAGRRRATDGGGAA
jgi:membrane protease YdiL (CAAX protease family)